MTRQLMAIAGADVHGQLLKVYLDAYSGSSSYVCGYVRVNVQTQSKSRGDGV